MPWVPDQKEVSKEDLVCHPGIKNNEIWSKKLFRPKKKKTRIFSLKVNFGKGWGVDTKIHACHK